eukprot:1192899-Prorocentrum_minimum.AAC.2
MTEIVKAQDGAPPDIDCRSSGGSGSRFKVRGPFSCAKLRRIPNSLPGRHSQAGARASGGQPAAG